MDNQSNPVRNQNQEKMQLSSKQLGQAAKKQPEEQKTPLQKQESASGGGEGKTQTVNAIGSREFGAASGGSQKAGQISSRTRNSKPSNPASRTSTQSQPTGQGEGQPGRQSNEGGASGSATDIKSQQRQASAEITHLLTQLSAGLASPAGDQEQDGQEIGVSTTQAAELQVCVDKLSRRFTRLEKLSDHFEKRFQQEQSQSMAQLQEDFFRQIQAKEEEITKLQSSLEFRAELSAGVGSKEATEGATDKPLLDQAVYQEEEQYAKKRKDAGIKYSKISSKLQSLWEMAMTDQGMLAKRGEGVGLLVQMSEIVTGQIHENKSQQLGRIKQASKTKSLEENINFLEQRLSAMLTEKEEQAIKLKSEIIVHKSKAKQCKQQMLKEKEDFDNKSSKMLAEQVEAAKGEYIGEMRQIQQDNQRLSKEIDALTHESKELSDRNKDLEKEILDVSTEKDEIIQGLNGKLMQIQSKWEKRLAKVGGKKEETQKRLNVEEKERELFGLKLEQVMINNKKLMLQKKFLEKQLEKDIRELHLEMNKIQIEIQQDQLMNSSSALQRFHAVYQAVSDQLTYVQQIVGFMDFDQEGAPGGGSTGVLPGGQQPQSFEEIAKEINETLQPGRGGSPTASPEHQQLAPGGELMYQGYPTGGPLDPPSATASQIYDHNQEGGMTAMAGLDGQGQVLSSSLAQGQNMLHHPSRPNPAGNQRGPALGGIGSPLGGRLGQQQPLLSLDECVTSYPRELLTSLLEALAANFREARMHESEHLMRIGELVNGHVDRRIVDEIAEKYLMQQRVQFSQYVHTLNDKCKSLALERKNLQFKVRRAKLDMKRMDEGLEHNLEGTEEMIEEEGATERSRGSLQPGQQSARRREPSATGRLDEDDEENPRKDKQDDDPAGQISGRQASGAGGQAELGQGAATTASPAVPGHFHLSQVSELEQQIDLLRQENVALKERCKEIRLNLQRKITELQDTLTISKQKYLTELSELKVEYGKDLNVITRSSRERSQERKKVFDALKEEELEQLTKDFETKEEKLRQQIDEKEKWAKEAIQEADVKVRDAERDLKKLKKESTGYFTGGWGTFIISFEDENVLQELADRQAFGLGRGGSPSTSQRATPVAVSTPAKKSKGKGGGIDTSQVSGRSGGSVNSSRDGTLDVSKTHPHPIEKISHFVEVGFLIDRNNFRLLDTFEEATYDSNLKKYLFELQDPLDSADNHQMNDLECKIKQQLTDNVGLFNEINPVYISLNMGRPATPFRDDYVTQDLFRLVKREGLYIMGNRWMVVNFLKCDHLTQPMGGQQPSSLSVTNTIEQDTPGKEKPRVSSGKDQWQYKLRVIAFENSTSSQYSFDLEWSDLLTLVHGHIRLLEDENSHDLCQIILNNLTMIKREKPKPGKKGELIWEDVLIVEHKIFFNEEYRAGYDKKNKTIRAKYDKKRQGLVKDVSLATDFAKSVIYEAFDQVYLDQVGIQSTQRLGCEETLNIQILRGKMSGNVKLIVTFVNQNNMVREMCLFAEEQQRSHKICSEIVHVGKGSAKVAIKDLGDGLPEQQNDETSALAYVVSLEKLYGMEDILVVRLVLIEKWDQNVMMEYSWNPEARPQEGSTQFSSETLYLVKKSDSTYCRVTEYEILNTEVRTQLFMHSYGYLQSNLDFGNVRRYLEHGENRRNTYLSMMSSDLFIKEAINVNIKEPAEQLVFKGLNQLIYRHFCIVRVRHGGPDKNRQADDRGSRGALEQEEGSHYSPENDPHLAMNQHTGTSELAEPEEGEIKNYYALIAVFDDGQCVQKGELIIKIVIQELQIDVMSSVEIIKEVVPLARLRDIATEDHRLQICEEVIDKLVISESYSGGTARASAGHPSSKSYRMMLEKDIQPMSEYVGELKQVRFEEMLRHEEGRNDDSKIEMELKDVASLQISLVTLADCPKTSQMTLINQKLYKVTANFVSNQRGFEPKIPEDQRIFDWHFIHVEVAQRSKDQQIVFAVTEKDIVSLIQKLRQKMRVEGKELTKELVSKKMSREDILNLVLDSFIMHPETFEVSLSMLHLNQRFLERSALEEQFIVTGGRFVHLNDGQDPELQQFKTVISQTELTKKLIQNVQKDMSDKTFDVKLYELELKSIPGTKKIRCEIFWVEEPDIVFRCDMFSADDQDGTQIIIEKINIVEQLELRKLEKGIITEDQYDPSKFAKDGLVLAICESTFPHKISFMLIEPCSRIQWEGSYQDEKLNVIESRQQRLNLVSNLKEALSVGILRGTDDKQRSLRIEPGEQAFVGEEQHKDTLYCKANLAALLMNSRANNPYELIYAQSVEIAPGIFRNLTAISDFSKNKLILRMSPMEEEGRGLQTDEGRGFGHNARGSSYQFLPPAERREHRELHISLNSQMEGSRIVTGCLSFGAVDDGLASHAKNLIYTVEVSSALSRKEQAIRFSLYNQAAHRTIMNVVFIDAALYDASGCLRGETEFALLAGFQHSMAILQQMSCLNYDFSCFELAEEVKLKLANSRGVDLMREFREPAGSRDQEESPVPPSGKGVLNKRSKDEDTAFVSLAKLKERMINRSLKNNTLLYRKVLRLDHGKRTVMISALREENPMFEETPADPEVGRAQKTSRRSMKNERHLIKLVLLENKRIEAAGETEDGQGVPTGGHSERSSQQNLSRMQQNLNRVTPNQSLMGNQAQPRGAGPNQSVQKSSEQIFVYRFDEMFSPQDRSSYDLSNVTVLKRITALAISKRLRIREIPDHLDLENKQSKYSDGRDLYQVAKQKQRLMAFFVDEKQLNELPKNPTQKMDVLEGRKHFDMRKLHSFALLEPAVKVIPGESAVDDSLQMIKQNLIYQFEKDDLLFEVFEILNPQEISIRLKIYDNKSFKMIRSCDITDGQMRVELKRDRKTFLAGPQAREDLAKYIIENSFYDEKNKTFRYAVSDLVEDYDV